MAAGGRGGQTWRASSFAILQLFARLLLDGTGDDDPPSMDLYSMDVIVDDGGADAAEDDDDHLVVANNRDDLRRRPSSSMRRPKQ